MTNWLFVTKIPTQDFEKLLQNKNWPLKETSRYKHLLAPKDKVIFYRGIPHGKQFVGQCILKSKPELKNDNLYTLRFSNVKKWKNGIPIENHLDEIELIRNKKYWPMYLMGGIIRLSNKDFNTILSLADKHTSS